MHNISHCTELQDAKEKSSIFKLNPLTCEVDESKTRKLELNPPKKKLNCSLSGSSQQTAAGSSRPAGQQPSARDRSSRYIHSASRPSLLLYYFTTLQLVY
jgi:hypothetical protein